MRTLRLFAGIGVSALVAAIIGIAVSNPLASGARAAPEGTASADNAQPAIIPMQVDRSRKGDRLRPAQPKAASRVVVVTITRGQSMMPDPVGVPDTTAVAAVEGQPRPFPCEGSSIRRHLNPQTPRIRCYA
jgi:hypothetical protein